MTNDNRAGALNEALKALKGKLPAQSGNPGPGEEDEEEDDAPLGPRPGMEEGAGRTGKEMLISPEQAGRLLEGFKLGGDARLPMSEGTAGKPRDRKGQTW